MRPPRGQPPPISFLKMLSYLTLLMSAHVKKHKGKASFGKTCIQVYWERKNHQVEFFDEAPLQVLLLFFLSTWLSSPSKQHNPFRLWL